MKNNLKQNRHIKNAVLFSSCLLGMLGVGTISHQNTVHADVNNTTNSSSQANQSNTNSSATQSSAAQSSVTQSSATQSSVESSTTQSSAESSTESSVESSVESSTESSTTQSSNKSSTKSSAESSTKSDNISYRIADDNSNTPVSSFQSDGVIYDIDSDGNSYVAQDPSVIAAISADNQSLNSSDYLPQNGVDSYGTTYESAVNSANASIYAAFDSAAGLNSDGTPISNANLSNSATQSGVDNRSTADDSQYASLSPDSLNQIANSVAAELSSAQSSQSVIKANLDKAQTSADTANSDKNQAETALSNAIIKIKSMDSLSDGETLDSYTASLNSAYDAKSAAQSAINSATSAANLANSNVAQYTSAVNSAQNIIDGFSTQISAIGKQQHINNLTANVQTKVVTIFTGDSYNPSDSFISATNSDGQVLNLNDFKITSNVNSSKGVQPQDYTVTFNYHSTNTTATVHVINDSSLVLRRDNDQHPYSIYVGDPFDPNTLITTLTDDHGNNVDPATAQKEGRLTVNQIPGDFSNEGKNVTGYFLSYNYYPDGQQYAPVFNGQVKVYTLNNSNLTTQPANLTVDNSFNQKSVITGLVNAHGNADTYDNAINNGQLTFNNINTINSSKPGIYPITATYYGKQYQINVNVLDKTSLGLANNTTIKAGTTFDPESGVSTVTDVKGNVTNYNTVQKDGALTISGLDKFNANIPGTYTINYNYGGKNYPYQITVDSQKDIEYTRNPTAFYTGSNITPDEIFKTITNDVGKTISYDDAVKDGLQFSLSNVNTNKAGTYITKVIYGGIVYPLEIQIQQAPAGTNNNSAQPSASNSASASFNNSANNSNSTNNLNNSSAPTNSSNSNLVQPANNDSSHNSYSVNNNGNITFYTNGGVITTSSSASTSSSANNSNSSANASSSNKSSATSNSNKSSAEIKFTKVGKSTIIYVNNSAPTYKFNKNDKENHGVYNINKSGYTKVQAQLVKTESGIYYKFANGKYIDADTKGLKNVIKAGKHQVQLTSNSVKVYRHLFKRAKSVKNLVKGTVLHVDKVVSHKNKLYYKLFDDGKNYFVQADSNKFTDTVGLIDGMELYIHGQANIYKDMQLKHIKSSVQKGKSLTAILKKVNTDGTWETNKGYINGKKLLKESQIYNNIFGN